MKKWFRCVRVYSIGLYEVGPLKAYQGVLLWHIIHVKFIIIFFSMDDQLHVDVDKSFKLSKGHSKNLLFF